MNTSIWTDDEGEMDPELRASLTPAQVLEILKEGNQRFLKGTGLVRDSMRQIEATSLEQKPFAFVLSCIDSRIPTELVFDQGIGDIFNARVAGNIVNQDVLGSMEFACKLSGARLIVILGHTSCGAIRGACSNAKLGLLTQLLEKIEPAVEATESEPGELRTADNPEFLDRVALKNVELAIEGVYDQSATLRSMLDAGEIAIVGAMYDVSSGNVFFVETPLC